MAIFLVVIGVLIVSAGLRNTQGQLGNLIVSDFSGEGNFWYFICGIFIAGSLGYYAPFRDSSRLLIGLILLVFVLSNNGLWAQLENALSNPLPANATGTSAVSPSGTSAVSSSNPNPNGASQTGENTGSVTNPTTDPLTGLPNELPVIPGL
jgi:hypothetical protein